MATTATQSPAADPTKKRKRSAPEADELEIDVNLPEPPSKKALRRAKKGKPSSTPKESTKDQSDLQDAPAEDDASPAVAEATDAPKTDDPAEKPKRSAHGIWIGNLPFHVTPAHVKTFFTTKASLAPEQITRIHLPLSTRALPSYSQPKPRPAKEQMANKGFAYVDFDTPEALFQALQATEAELEGRRVLIKDATSFVGRPDPVVEKTAKPVGQEKPRSKRVFVGNLGFDVTREDVEGHFAQAGDVEDVFLASFEDSGKCKGFGWVRFGDEDAAEKAVKGWIWKVEGGEEGEEEEEADELKIEKDVKVETDGSDSSGEDKDGSGGSDSPSSATSDDEVEITVEAKTGKKSKVAAKEASAAKSASSKALKKRKWWINKLYGRLLRCEFAEDAQTRYKKRYGKAKPSAEGNVHPSRQHLQAESAAPAIEEVKDGAAATVTDSRKLRSKGDVDQRADARRRKHQDARKIAPGQALANAPRASGAIVEGKGKKTTFN